MPSYAPPLLLMPTDQEGNPLPIKRKPGRPRKQVVPSIHELEVAKLVNADRDLHVESDVLVQALETKTSTPEILRHVILELAIESAAIRHEIRSAQAASKSDGIPQKMSRRIDALSKMASVSLDSHKLGLVEANPNCEAVQRIFEFFLRTVGGVAAEVIPDAGSFMDECRRELEGWESRVE